MASSIMDEYKAYGRPITTPLTEIAILIRTMPYGDLMELAKAAQDSPMDEQINKTAGLLWFWARNQD